VCVRISRGSIRAASGSVDIDITLINSRPFYDLSTTALYSSTRFDAAHCTYISTTGTAITDSLLILCYNLRPNRLRKGQTVTISLSLYMPLPSLSYTCRH